MRGDYLAREGRAKRAIEVSPIELSVGEIAKRGRAQGGHTNENAFKSLFQNWGGFFCFWRSIPTGFDIFKTRNN
jgi:hypothetical protein